MRTYQITISTSKPTKEIDRMIRVMYDELVTELKFELCNEPNEGDLKHEFVQHD